jgi:hypothetical protein
MNRTIPLRCFPATDGRFRRDARAALESLGSRVDPVTLERELRRWYPACVVHDRDGLAAVTASTLWYVYRDGRARPRYPRSQRLYDALGRSRDLIASTLAAVDRAAAFPAGDQHRARVRAHALHVRFDGDATATSRHGQVGR